MHKDLGLGRYRKSRPVSQRVILWWKAHQKQPWFLGTDLPWGWRKVCSAYCLRMTIKELFRDHKNLRYGWGLRHVELSDPRRLERLLLVLAFACILRLLAGLICQQRLCPRHWSAAISKKKQASAFFVGRLMQDRLCFPLPAMLALLAVHLTQIVKENWGCLRPESP